MSENDDKINYIFINGWIKPIPFGNVIILFKLNTKSFIEF